MDLPSLCLIGDWTSGLICEGVLWQACEKGSARLSTFWYVAVFGYPVGVPPWGFRCSHESLHWSAGHLSMPQRCGFDRSSLMKNSCPNPRKYPPGGASADYRRRGTSPLLGRPLNDVPYLSENFRFRSLNVNWPYVRTVHKLSHHSDFLSLTPSRTLQLSEYIA
jgi:hypothetical protein